MDQKNNIKSGDNMIHSSISAATCGENSELASYLIIRMQDK
jgi:hypothetical protein